MPTLEWIGKEKVINHHQEVPFRVLERKYSFDEKGQHKADNGSENMIIRGDNLEALKALLPQYEGKVKCIYIDPPYNTGTENWVYNDNVNDPKIKRWLGEVVGKEGEDLSRHDKWLCMMYPRLKLLQKLLADDGAIFISIDDNEQANLKLICDEIFGGGNFVDIAIWEKKYSPQNAVKWLSECHDYILIYAKNKDCWRPNLLERTEEMNDRYKNPDNDQRGIWKAADATAQAGHGTAKQFYILKAPNGKEHKLPRGRCWLYTEEVMKQKIADNRIWFGSTGNNVPAVKKFLTEVKQGIACKTIWFRTEVGDNQEATKEIKNIFDEDILFSTPKPVRLIERILQIASYKDSMILDSFAGSGTTAHAVLNRNKQDGGTRKFILVEMENYAETTTAERVRRVINGYADVPDTGGNFSFYELGERLLLDNGNLNEKVETDKIREYVWFMETKGKMPDNSGKGNAYFLGINNETAYYFYYERERVTTLNHAFLKTIVVKAGGYIIYADINVLSQAEMKKFGIVFKKIPRDIAKL